MILKVPILYAWAYLERSGVVSRNETCDLDSEVQVEGFGFSRHLHQRILPYHDVLLMMVAVSDNLCTNLGIRRLGIPTLNEVFRALNLPVERIGRKLMDYEARALGLENRISAEDCIRLYEVRDELHPDERIWTDQLLLWNTDLGLWLRSTPRDTVDLCHKTGGLTGVLHELGYTKDADLFLLTQGVQDESEIYRLLDGLGPALLRGSAVAQQGPDLPTLETEPEPI